MKRSQKGFGLVELMIAMVIGLVLLLGLTTILVSMNRTAELRRRMAEVQGGQRLAMALLSNSIRYAGSFTYISTTPATTVFPAVPGSFAAGQSLVSSGPDAEGDTFAVRFVASSVDTASQGCSANLVAGNRYTNVFSISSDDYLVCTETDTTVGTTTTNKLIGKVTGMTVLYGVDTTGGGFVSKYLTSAEVSAPANLWDSVKTVRIKLTFTNPLAGEAGQQPTLSITQTIPHVIGL